MKKKNVGILTFHRAHNYGAVLQAFALQEVLSDRYSVEIIDYNPDFLIKPYKVFNLNITKPFKVSRIFLNFIVIILSLKSRIKRKINFDLFINNKFKLSQNVEGESIPKHFEAYIFGSDQIWNHEITNGINNIYWGNFEAKKSAKKISYAASLGHATVNYKVEEQVRASLLNFHSISVREKEAVHILNKVSNSEINEVLDPTLLLDYNFWSSHAIKPNINKKYILVYQVRKNSNTISIAKSLAKDIGGVVIEIPSQLDRGALFNNIATTSPEEFIGYFKFAHCVITTSFHGTAFSLIFNVPFYTINLEDGSENRAKNLLENVGLESRMITKKSLPSFEKIDYTFSNSKMDKLKKQSLHFLFNSIEGDN
jgi:hypothetical protein